MLAPPELGAEAGNRATPFLLFVLAIELIGSFAMSLTTSLGWDGLAVWGLKARALTLGGHFPVSYLSDASRQWSHLDYPWLLPLNEAWLYFLLGGVNEGAVKILFPLVFSSLLALYYSAIRRVHSRSVALLFTCFVCIVPSINSWASTGFADMTITMFWTSSVLYLHHWLQDGRRFDLVIAALLAAFAAWTKQEGLIYFGIQVIAAAISPLWGKGISEAIRAVALLIGLGTIVLGPWLAMLVFYRVPHNDFVPITGSYTIEHLSRLPISFLWTIRELLQTSHWGLLWPVALIAWLVWKPCPDRRVRAYLLAACTLPLLFFSADFIYSRWEPFTDHIGSSIDRLVLQQSVLGLAIIALGLGPSLERGAIRSTLVLFDHWRTEQAGARDGSKVVGISSRSPKLLTGGTESSSSPTTTSARRDVQNGPQQPHAR